MSVRNQKLSPKEKYSILEFAYYCIGGYSLCSAKAIHVATLKFQGTANTSFFDPTLIFLGAFSPITAMTSELSFTGVITGIFILVSPFIGAVLIKDFKRNRFGSYCFLMTMTTASQIVTGTWYNPMAALGGLISLIVVGAFVLIAAAQMVSEEAKKQFGIETKDEKLARLRRESEDRNLMYKILSKK